MTLKELSQIPHLKEEIALYRERIDVLMRNENNAERLRLQSLADKRTHELKLLEEYIENVTDSGIRNLLILRCVLGLSWVQISFRVRGYSADNARIAVKRYLSKN